MILNEAEIERALKLAKAEFPRFSNWRHSNVVDDSYSGFALWGEYNWDTHNPTSREFYVTFETFESSWKGILTIGQHSYFWSSAECGEAHLLDTPACPTLDEAIARLKVNLAILFADFCVPSADARL